MKELFVCKKILLLQTYIYKQLLVKYINLGDYFLLFCGGEWYKLFIITIASRDTTELQ